MSASLSKKHQLKKNYSDDVFVRLNQDEVDRGERRKNLKEKRTEEEGGFHPVLCSKSRILAEQSKINRDARGRTNKKLANDSYHHKCKTKHRWTPTKQKCPVG
jgi:hypothetical protein